MRVLRKLVYREVLMATGLVATSFLGLFFFFDLLDELGSLGRPSVVQPGLVYQFQHAVIFVALLIPSRLYELLPIAVLIGSVLVFARLAQSSEFTILRTSGLGPWRALWMLSGLGLALVLFTYLTGDHLAPLAGKAAQLYRARFEGGSNSGPAGAWLREQRTDGQATVHVQSMGADEELRSIRILQFDTSGQLIRRIQAASGHIAPDAHWKLVNATELNLTQSNTGTPVLQPKVHPELRWETTLRVDMVSVALLKPERMSTIDLWRYVKHLDANGQSGLRYEIEFWRKVFYPLSCLVMLVLALPFAYLHFRSGTIAGYVFVGVMVGISFFLLNNVFGYIGRLNEWRPWLAAAAPSVLYSMVSLGAFGWLVLRQ